MQFRREPTRGLQRCCCPQSLGSSVNDPLRVSEPSQAALGRGGAVVYKENSNIKKFVMNVNVNEMSQKSDKYNSKYSVIS